MLKSYFSVCVPINVFLPFLQRVKTFVTLLGNPPKKSCTLKGKKLILEEQIFTLKWPRI